MKFLAVEFLAIWCIFPHLFTLCIAYLLTYWLLLKKKSNVKWINDSFSLHFVPQQTFADSEHFFLLLQHSSKLGLRKGWKNNWEAKKEENATVAHYTKFLEKHWEWMKKYIRKNNRNYAATAITSTYRSSNSLPILKSKQKLSFSSIHVLSLTRSFACSLSLYK